MASEYSLPAVFMLDDTVLSISKVNTEEHEADGEVAIRTDGKHTSSTSVPLFTCLRDLEMQLYGGKQPPGSGLPEDFTPFPERPDLHNTTESFTGPWPKFGIIGVLRNSQFVNRCKRPFNRTHVYSVILMNIKALTERDLFYKPWPVSSSKPFKIYIYIIDLAHRVSLCFTYFTWPKSLKMKNILNTLS